MRTSDRVECPFLQNDISWSVDLCVDTAELTFGHTISDASLPDS